MLLFQYWFRLDLLFITFWLVLSLGNWLSFKDILLLLIKCLVILLKDLSFLLWIWHLLLSCLILIIRVIYIISRKLTLFFKDNSMILHPIGILRLVLLLSWPWFSISSFHLWNFLWTLYLNVLGNALIKDVGPRKLHKNIKLTILVFTQMMLTLLNSDMLSLSRYSGWL